MNDVAAGIGELRDFFIGQLRHMHSKQARV